MIPRDVKKTIELDGVSVPSFMYGTAWKEEATTRLAELAIEQGFRAIDTANQRKHYYEEGVGKALASAYQRGLCTRDDLFLQTKFTYLRGQDHRLPYDPDATYPDQVRQSFESSLAHLGTDRIDSYVLHGPYGGRGLALPDREVWGAMSELQKAGKARFLGVSNVNLDQLRSFCEEFEVAPRFVQNRCFARTAWDRDVRSYCEDRGIIYQGFSLLTANPEVVSHPLVAKIARRFDRTPAEVVFRFSLEIGMMPLTGTSQAVHMQKDLSSIDFRLEPDEVHSIEVLATERFR